VSSTLEAARATLALDIYPVPIKPGMKRPPMRGWQNCRLTVDDLQEHFSNGNGLGWLLGIKPRPIADVDIDCGEAVAVSSLIPLPKTNRIFGRLSNPCSHYLYELPEEFESESFKDPLRNGTDKHPGIIELRGRGGQTVVPPSVHPSGEQIKWEHEGDFGKTTLNVLQILVAKIAAASLLVRYWPRGHETRHAIAGMLARAGWDEKDTVEFVCALLHFTQPDNREGLTDVRNCYARLERGDEVAGRPKLEALFGENGKLIVNTVTKWLALRNSTRPPGPSYSLITNENGIAKGVLANAITLLREAPEWQGVLGFNEFSLHTVARKPTPWRKSPGTNWTNTDDIRTAEWLQHNSVLVSAQIAADAVQAIAEENSFHPVRDYLDSLEWDGTKRLVTWLITYLGASQTRFIEAVGTRWVISAVARIYQPGCQADHTLLLEGAQGIKKSTALGTMAVKPEWFTDHISDLNNKDARIELHGVWIVELAELASVKRSLTEKVKSFLTARKDHFRPPYGRRAVDVPRTNVFAGSVNDATPFTDETGNRRFWPVRCGTIDIGKLTTDRDQIWAEALNLYRAEAPWWLDTDELNHLASEEQEARYEPGVWDETILPWLEDPTQRNEWDHVSKHELPISPFNSTRDAVTITDVLVHAVGKKLEACNQGDRNQVARCLTHAGWEQKRKRVNEKSLHFYTRTGR
jgi:predicted P-loop ATPase